MSESRWDDGSDAGMLELLGFTDESAQAASAPAETPAERTVEPAQAPAAIEPSAGLVTSSPAWTMPAPAEAPSAVAPAASVDATPGSALLPVASVTAAPGSAPQPAATPAPSSAVVPVSEPALTRRELRERERAAAGSAPRSGRAEAARDTPRPSSAPAASSRSGRGTPPRSDSRRPARAPRSGPSIGARLLSLGAMIFAAALVVGMSIPATVFSTSSAQADAALADPSLASVSVGQAQSVEMSDEATAELAEAAAESTGRDEWTVLSWAEVLKQRYGTRDFNYGVGGWSGPVRWPFPVAVGISSGYGERVAPCRGCSSLHMGVDFDPGVGAAIFAMADGVVTVSQDDQWGFGTHVIIQHQIDGRTVTSTYAHMQSGSTPLSVGDQVSVGDFVGLVGSTGTATGPHLHFEVTVDGVHVDPFTYLTHYAS